MSNFVVFRGEQLVRQALDCANICPLSATEETGYLGLIRFAAKIANKRMTAEQLYEAWNEANKGWLSQVRKMDPVRFDMTSVIQEELDTFDRVLLALKVPEEILNKAVEILEESLPSFMSA